MLEETPEGPRYRAMTPAEDARETDAALRGFLRGRRIFWWRWRRVERRGA